MRYQNLDTPDLPTVLYIETFYITIHLGLVNLSLHMNLLFLPSDFHFKIDFQAQFYSPRFLFTFLLSLETSIIML